MMGMEPVHPVDGDMGFEVNRIFIGLRAEALLNLLSPLMYSVARYSLSLAD